MRAREVLRMWTLQTALLRAFAVGVAVLHFAGRTAFAEVALPDPSKSAIMKNAIAAYRQNDMAMGDQIASSLTDPVARVTTEWMALRLLQDKAGFERINAFLIAHPNWPSVTLLRRRGEDALYTAPRNPKIVLDYFKRAEPLTPTGRFLLAEAWDETGQTKKAHDLVKRLWRQDPLPPDVETAILRRFGKVITAADRRARVDALLGAENWGGAERNAERESAQLAGYVRAMTAAAKREIDARALMTRLPQAFRSQELPRLFHTQSLRRADQLEEAARSFLSLPKAKALSYTEIWWTERRVLARRLFDAKLHSLALSVLSSAYTLPQTAKAEAAFVRGLIELQGIKRPVRAAAEFDLSLKYATTDNSKARAAYWRGLAHQAAGMPSEADFRQAASKHFGYYGFLARERLGQDRFSLRRAPQPDFNKARSDTSFVAVNWLMAAGESDAAVALAGEVVQRLPDASAIAALSSLGRLYQDGRFLLQVGREAMKRGMPFDEDAYPVEGFPEPPQIGVELPLVFAISRQESTFDPRAMSPVGARGLMQLMIPTARETARRNDLDFNEDRLLDDPPYNVRIGTLHLGELLETWSGSYLLSIAAYNAGSTNTRRWVEAYGDPRTGEIDPVVFVERIPFSETRNYVQRVLENVQIYRMRIERAPATQLTRDLTR